MQSNRNANDVHAPLTGAHDQEATLVDGLRTPLAVLRASLETLAYRFEERDPRTAQVTSAISQVARIQHDVQTLIEARQGLPLRPLTCTVHEIVACATRALVPEHRARTMVAVEGGSDLLFVDGPLVSRALTRLLESGLQHGTHHALLRARGRDGRAQFTVLHPAFAPRARSMQELTLEVARRDVERMGGSFANRIQAEEPTLFELAFEPRKSDEEAA